MGHTHPKNQGDHMLIIIWGTMLCALAAIEWIIDKITDQP
jgi:hypothetical protein